MEKISITLKQLETIVSRAVVLGKVETMNLYLPQSKYISRPALIGYLKVLGLGASQLAEWEDKHLIHDVQNGSGGTHKYSRLEIQKLLLAREIAGTV